MICMDAVLCFFPSGRFPGGMPHGNRRDVSSRTHHTAWRSQDDHREGSQGRVTSALRR